MADGSSVNVSAITSSPHAGTHADTPLHVTRGGAASESLPIAAFSGPATVVDVSHIDGEIEIEQIERAIERAGGGASTRRLLLRSGRSISDGSFPESWPRLSVRCAEELVERGVLLVGMDCPSADDRESKTLDVHHALLDHGVCVLENLDLRDAAPGTYELDALPMRIAGLDAAPVRAILR